MKKVRAVIYGVGAMNSISTRACSSTRMSRSLVPSPAARTRSARTSASSPASTGISARSSTTHARAVLAEANADVAVIAVNSYMADAVEQLRICAENGVNAVTLSEEALFPWNTSPEITKELDAIAKRTGATLTGTGHQDTYWVNIVAMMMAPPTTSIASRVTRAGTSTTMDPRSPGTSRLARASQSSIAG